MGKHNCLTSNFTVMKRVLNLVKRGAKWYFNQCSKSYLWYPSGIIPIVE